MRTISAMEIQFVAGGLFANVGQSIGSKIGGAIDSVLKIVGISTALSTSFGQIGAGLGYFADSLNEAFFGSKTDNHSVEYLNNAVTNLQNGISSLFGSKVS
ncbi:hypothetical protein [Commensalibacter oyaizuii]|uniref:Uncharacterized protein n=1 Tax=Commensalibacter oyaizuii TaxID=3043873 RepID=A0ABT6Q3I5_9PROT|nr:hypothetical protein [Commensalibacter sp. TBRC 16381]MDI2091659.1 hypothetical protein [Commensalibacter sp. TBRC 16381]